MINTGALYAIGSGGMYAHDVKAQRRKIASLTLQILAPYLASLCAVLVQSCNELSDMMDLNRIRRLAHPAKNTVHAIEMNE